MGDGRDAGRKRIQDRYSTLASERYRTSNSVLPSPEFTEWPCLSLKHSSNGLARVTILELLREWVAGQYRSVLVLQGRLEQDSKTR